MSAHDRTQFSGCFPFSSGRLQQTSPIPGSRAHEAALAAAGINGAGIPDSDAREYADVPSRPGPDVAALPRLRLLAGMRINRPPARQRPVRLSPLASFVWGSAALPPQPRTCPDHALIWVTGGQMQLEFPRQKHRLIAGDLRLIPAGTAFAALPMPGAEGHVALIPCTPEPGLEPALPRDGLAAQVGDQAAPLLALLRDLSAAPGGAALRAALTRLASCLALLDPARPERPAESRTSQNRPLVEDFLTLARATLGSCASVAELAEELRTTTAALDRACIAARGRRAVELIHEARLERAVELLRRSDHRPARIATELGYSSHAHFTRAFVAATGRSPDAFRAQLG